MKRRYILASLWLVIALLLLMILASSLKGSKLNWGNLFDWKSYVSANFDDGDYFFKYNNPAPMKNAYFTEGLNAVEVELKSIPLEITTSPDTMIHADFFDGADNFCTFTKTNNKLVVKEKKGFGLSAKKLLRGNIKMSLPASFDGKVKIESVSGAVRVNGLKQDSIDIETISGSIVFWDCEIGEVKSDSVSGSQKIGGNFASVNAETVSGSIELNADKPLLQNSEFSSVSGSILLNLLKSSDYTVYFDTVSGSFRDDITGVSGKKSGSSRNGSGNVKIDVSTVSGSIKIQ